MKIFNWFYSLTGLIFFNDVFCGDVENVPSTKDSSLTIELEKNDLINESSEDEDVAKFHKLLKEVNLMIKELKNTDLPVKWLNFNLFTILKELMNNSLKISQSSDRGVILNCLNESICLIDKFFPFYENKKNEKRDVKLFQLIGDIISKIKDLNLTLIKVENKAKQNLTKYISIEYKLKDLKGRIEELINNYETYLALLDNNTVFYNDMENSLINLKERFEKFKENVHSMEDDILTEKCSMFKVNVCLIFQPLARCFMREEEKLDGIFYRLKKIQQSTEDFKTLKE